MNSGKEIARGLLDNIVGMKPSRVKLGVGSFLTFDFGKDIPEVIKNRGETKTVFFGEWHLWVYLCSWRIDKNDVEIIRSSDDRELIEKSLPELDREITGIQLLTDQFDAKLQVEFHLISSKRPGDQQWKFFTPEGKVFIAGPLEKWSYENS